MTEPSEHYEHTPIPWGPAALQQEIRPLYSDEADAHTAQAGFALQRAGLGGIALATSGTLLVGLEVAEKLAESAQDEVVLLSLDISQGIGRFAAGVAAAFTVRSYLSARYHIGRKYDIRDAAIERELRQRGA